MRIERPDRGVCWRISAGTPERRAGPAHPQAGQDIGISRRFVDAIVRRANQPPDVIVILDVRGGVIQRAERMRVASSIGKLKLRTSSRACAWRFYFDDRVSTGWVRIGDDRRSITGTAVIGDREGPQRTPVPPHIK